MDSDSQKTFWVMLNFLDFFLSVEESQLEAEQRQDQVCNSGRPCRAVWKVVQVAPGEGQGSGPDSVGVLD